MRASTTNRKSASTPCSRWRRYKQTDLLVRSKSRDPPDRAICSASRQCHRSMSFEILHFALVLFRRRARLEGAEIATFAGLRIHLAGVEPVFAGFEFADHGQRSTVTESASFADAVKLAFQKLVLCVHHLI